jgi:hypothetical protein
VSTQAFSVFSFSTDNILFGTPVSYFFSKPQQDSEADKSAVLKFALRYPEEIAYQMFKIPEGMKVALVTGRDGEGREFFSFSYPLLDYLSLPQELRSQIGMKDEYDWTTPYEKAKGIKATRPRYTNVIGYIRFPYDLAKNTVERKLTWRNYSSVFHKLVDEIVKNPEGLITPV